MATMIAEAYDALKSAGAEDGKARAAATAIADCQRDISELKSDVKTVNWAVGLMLAFVVANLALSIRVMAG